MIATSAGWALPDLTDAILLLEDIEKYLGHIDRQLTMLRKSGVFKGVAVGRFCLCPNSKGLTITDILHDHLRHLNVPVLGGLPIGHNENTITVPVGTQATLDADRGTLTLESPYIQTSDS